MDNEDGPLRSTTGGLSLMSDIDTRRGQDCVSDELSTTTIRERSTDDGSSAVLMYVSVRRSD